MLPVLGAIVSKKNGQPGDIGWPKVTTLPVLDRIQWSNLSICYAGQLLERGHPVK